MAVPVDLDPFTAAGDVLHAGDWVAERWAGVGDFVSVRPDEVHPVVAQVLRDGAAISGPDVFCGQHALAALRRRSETAWDAVDVLLLPTTPCHPTVAAMEADPIGLHSVLGRWTTFANLLDLAVVAVPSVRTAAGLPVGVQLIGSPGSEDRLLGIAASWERAREGGDQDEERALLTVVGAHLSGQPLNALLLALVRLESGGVSVEAETWSQPPAALRFVCEPAGAAGAVDISDTGGWRAHLAGV